jgi:uridine kinase
MIGIAGPTGAGKTALVKLLAKQLLPEESSIISLDSYYHDLSFLDMNERKKQNFDSPDALDKELLILQLIDLSKGREIFRPIYLFNTNTRALQNEVVKPKKFILVEGLFTFFWDRIRDLFDFKIFIALDKETSLSRRLKRDDRERGIKIEDTKKQFEKHVYPMYQRYVRPSMNIVDMHLNGLDPLDKSVAFILARLKEAKLLSI